MIIGFTLIFISSIVMIFWAIQNGRSPIERPLIWYGFPLNLLLVVWIILLLLGLYFLFKVNLLLSVVGLIIFYPIFPILLSKTIKDLMKKMGI